MEQYEANLDGTIEIGPSYTDFDEVDVLRQILEDAFGEENCNRTFIGRGGYYRYKINTDSKDLVLHIYLKRLTFGGRASRPKEKRAQFSAAIDRSGFVPNTDKEISLIFAFYKRNIFNDTVICAWDINDWGHNIGRAFNCFVDIQKVAEALRDSFAKHTTAIGQTVCCFRPERLQHYLQNKEQLHHDDSDDFNLEAATSSNKKLNDTLPTFDDLFQTIVDILKEHKEVKLSFMEQEASKRHFLSQNALSVVHNADEGPRSEFGYRLAWARFYLKRAGYIDNPIRGLWIITDYGKTTVVNKESIKRITTGREIRSDYFEEIEEEDSTLEDKGEIVYPFDPNLVAIRTKSMSLDLILKRLDRGEVDLETSFQRKAGLWDLTKQSRLIESILIKFPLPAFYFDGSNDDNWLVVDGLQRLTSLDNFVNKLEFRLQGLEFLNQYEGYTFNQLPGNLQRRIEEFETTTYIIEGSTPKPLKYNVFKRINTGGLTLTSQEIRNALNQGSPAYFVKRLAELESFKIATAYSINPDRMLDREFVTRFSAFYLFPIEDYKSDLESFMNMAMEKMYELSKQELSDMEKRFDKAMQTAFNIFGDDTFRKRYHPSDRRKPINKALFEAWSVSLSKLNDYQHTTIIARKEELKAKLMNLLNNSDEWFDWAISSGTNDRAKVKKRFDEIDRIIQETIKDQ